MIKRVALAVVLAATACSSSGTSTSSSKLRGTVTVDAAASLTEAFGTLKANFEKAHPGTKIDVRYGPSSEFATQIQNGASVDVFASASKKNMTSLGGQAPHPTEFVKNTMEIAVPPSNPAKIGGLDDLAKAGVKLAVCDPAVPCGDVAKQVLANAKLSVRPAASLADVKATLAAVESGEVDAGLVYVTDVRAAGRKVKGIEIPADVNASTTYPIAVLKGAKNPRLARAWVDYVVSADGRQVLKADGFLLP